MTIESKEAAPVGNGAAELDLTELVARHQAMVWRYLRALGAEAALADDLTQDTFLEIMRRPLVQFSDAATASYLRRVAHNLFITRRRREARMLVTEHAEQFEIAWVRWAGFESGDAVLDALQNCFERLSQRAQLALRLRYGQERSRQEIAESLKITEHGAKNLMQRAKSQLRECLEKKLQ
ncbi:MAG: sigma-70 family RNA polymerase sigma factor [Planctomycetales bacterium]|nr:sigma-70 family RNA polymerase sigma factor [Planctomycetales bacterium]